MTEDACVCGRRWADLPATHAATTGTDGSSTCGDYAATKPPTFLAWTTLGRVGR